MTKNIIIGAGFSACIAKIFVKKDVKIIGSYGHAGIKNLIRRKKIESNKLFSNRSYSYGSLNFQLKDGTFQDRLIFGGNSRIWGGKINIGKISKKILNKLQDKNIYFMKLSFDKTGTISNQKNIVQMQNKKEEIITTSDFPFKIQNGYLLKFDVIKKKIFLTLKNFNNLQKKITVNKLYLCVGNVQLLDILYRSNLIKENDIIEFSEFDSDFKLKSIYSKFNPNITIQRFLFSRALGHFFGVQYFSKFLKLLSFIPLCIDQNFYKKKTNYKLQIKKGFIVEKHNKNNKINIGKSTHFCNLRINKVNINKFLKKINPNIKGFGMAFINQKTPGPISNDIILDIYKKLN